MEDLISFQNTLLREANNHWHRYLYPALMQEEKLLGLKGLRGVGKTTMLLQYLAYDYSNKEQGLYVTADHPHFYNHTLLELAAEWYKYGGKLLLIDEVHKYPNWSNELKLIYDGHPGMRTIFTSSSALDLFRGTSDLSRRLITHTLHGLSFREYLDFQHGITFEAVSLQELLEHHHRLTGEIMREVRILPLFRQYLRTGYLPFGKDIRPKTIPTRLLQIINTVVESDLAYIEGYSADNIHKLKKLLGVIAESAPFEPNISRIAARLGLGRNTVNIYLKSLHNAGLLTLLSRSAAGMSRLQKPDKIYFENPNFTGALQPRPNPGTIRETFFMNQLRNAGYRLQLSPQAGDFSVEGQYIFEIGGKNKKGRQLSHVPKSYLVKDDIESGLGRTVPLWLFGFLY